MEFVEIKDLNNKELESLYIDSFPKEERIDFNDMFSGVFKPFKLYALYDNNALVGMAHFNETDNFVHLNYLAVSKNYQSKGYGAYIISWLKEKFNNKAIVVDIEELTEYADNNFYRIKRKKFYKRNGFNEGQYTFIWEGVYMTYMHTCKIDANEFMKYIQIIFPTIIDVKKK